MEYLKDAILINSKDYGFEMDNVYLTTDYTGMLLNLRGDDIYLIGFIQFEKLAYPPFMTRLLASQRGFIVDDNEFILNIIGKKQLTSQPVHLNVVPYDGHPGYYQDIIYGFIVEEMPDGNIIVKGKANGDKIESLN
jgi:hypothetical protein